MSKKIISIISIVTLFTLTSLVACGKSDAKEAKKNEALEVASEEVQKDTVNLDDFTVSSLSVKTVTSSSVLKDGNGISYDSILVSDKDDSTAWVEGVNGNGIDEWIKLEFDGDVVVKELFVTNGYTKNSKIYYSNNRVKKVKLEFSDGTTLVSDFKDGISSLQPIVLDKGIKTSFIKIIILDVFEGDKYQDTCIGEIEVKGFRNIENLSDKNIEKLNEKEYKSDTIVEKVIGKQTVEEIPTTNSASFTEKTLFSEDGYVMYKGIKLPSDFEKVTQELMQQIAEELTYKEATDIFKNYGYSDKAIFEYLLPYHPIEE